MFTLAEWMPDAADLSKAASEAKNCLWLNGRYRQLNNKTTSTSAFSGTCLGAYSFIRANDNTRVYAGTASSIYELDSAGWTERGSGYSLVDQNRWEFCQFGNDIIAATPTEVLQRQASATGAFADISGSPQAACVWALRDFVMCGDIDGSPNLVRWCAIGDATDWPTPGSNDAQIKQAGEQSLRAQAGRVVAIRGSEYAIIFQEESITRATYIGGGIVWQFDPIDEKRGAAAPLAVVQIGREIYYLAKDGFFVTDGASSSRPIGYGKVDEWFRTSVDKSNIHRVTGAHDPERKIIIWSFPSTAATGGAPDSEIIYNYAEDKWTHSEIGFDFIFSAASPGVTLEGLDAFSSSIDDLEASLDSAQWLGGGGYLGGIQNGYLYSFEGPALTATIDTGEFQAQQGRRSFLAGVRPESDGTVTVSVGHRSSPSSSVTWTASSSVNASSGWAPFRVNDFYMRIRLTIAGGFTDAVGAHIEVRGGGYK